MNIRETITAFVLAIVIVFALLVVVDTLFTFKYTCKICGKINRDQTVWDLIFTKCNHQQFYGNKG